MTTYISVNRNTIASNAKHKRADPPIRIARGRYGKPDYARELEILGPSRLIYNPREAVLPCGARLAIATDAGVRIIR